MNYKALIMRLLRNKLVQFIMGLIIGLSLSCIIWFNSKAVKDMKIVIKKSYSSINSTRFKVPLTDDDLYDRTVADEMFKEVRVLCWVMTNPSNHKTKAIHVKNTWGKRCNKLLFMSSETDLELGAIALPVNEGRENLWDKTKSAFQYVYQNHYDEADWFIKADDDSYLVMENVRYMLSQYHHKTSLFFGCRYTNENHPEGYMAGGGYILSKKALSKFNKKILNNEDVCHQGSGGAEDFEMGKCLAKSAIFVDTRDEFKQMRFFALSIHEHFLPNRDPNFWYFQYLYYEVMQGNLDCCSNTIAGMHYIGSREMYSIDYLIYHVHPYGLSKYANDGIPDKLTLKEILRRSRDRDPHKPFLENNNIVHQMDASEMF